MTKFQQILNLVDVEQSEKRAEAHKLLFELLEYQKEQTINAIQKSITKAYIPIMTD